MKDISKIIRKDRDKLWKDLVEKYGEEGARDWFYNLPIENWELEFMGSRLN